MINAARGGAVMDASNVSGGLRLMVDGMRGSPGRARSVVDTLRGIPGVREVVADPQTGSVAIRYEPHGTAVPTAPRPELPTAHPEAVPPRAADHSAVLTRIVETVVVVALEVALQRALGPFWPKRC